MGIFDDKRNLLNRIAALRSLNSEFPKLQFGNSFPSLNNLSSPIDFLLDLIKTLIGFEELKAELIRFLTYQTNSIEALIKQALRSLLKKYFSCSIDAIIPVGLIDTLGVGFNIAVKQVDFFDLLKNDPESEAGKLIYGNINQDLNRFLYDVLQNNTGTWKNLIVVSFLQQGVVDGIVKSNVFNIKIDASWQGRTVNDFINQFIDSVVLFTLPSLINRIIDSIFGTISSLLNISKKSAQSQVELSVLVNKVINLPDIEIDNSYYDFTQEDINNINRRTKEISEGYRILEDCFNVVSKIPIDVLNTTNNTIENSSNLIEIQETLSNQFTILSNEATSNLSDSSQNSGKLSFFDLFFRAVVQGFVNILFAPKIMFLFLTYFKVVGLSNNFVDFQDFFRQNRQLIVEIIQDVILPIIIRFLFNIVKKYITRLALADAIETKKELIKNQQLQTLSLIGVPQEIRDFISSL